MTPTPAQLAILRARHPGIGEPTLIRNAEALLQRDARARVGETAAVPVTAKPRLRQHQGDGMNKWEREYHRDLSRKWDHVYREVSLPLANGLRFKVDFLCVSSVEIREDTYSTVIQAHEVKGRALPTGIAKIKMAAKLYPWMEFHLATKRRKRDGAGWGVQRILP